MTLLRALARPMLASFFLASGYRAIKNPELFVEDAQPLADQIVPLAKKYAPEAIEAYIPDDTKTLIRINGGLQLVGGFALATGKGRRLGAVLLAASLVPSTLARHPFWTRTDPEEKAADRSHFLKNVSLLGGVLIASADTEGKPSLAWRATATTQSLSKDGKKTKKKLSKKGRKALEGAIVEGAAVVDIVVKETRRAKREAVRLAAEVEHQAKQAKEAAAKQAREAKNHARQAARAAKRGAAEVASNIELGAE